MIGGKGVGKSLAIEFLRFGLNQTSAEELIRKRSNIKKTSKTTYYWQYGRDCPYQRANGSQFQINRQFEGPDEEIRAVGELEVKLRRRHIYQPADPYLGDITTTFPVLAYSQTEVIDIAENKNVLLKLD